MSTSERLRGGGRPVGIHQAGEGGSSSMTLQVNKTAASWGPRDSAHVTDVSAAAAWRLG